MARTSKAGAQDPATQDPEKPETEEGDGAEGGESGSSEQTQQGDAASNAAPPSEPPPRAEAAEAPQSPPRQSLIAMLESRSKQALATGDYRVHGALDQLVGAAHHLKSKANHALETLTGDDAELVRQLYRAL